MLSLLWIRERLTLYMYRGNTSGRAHPVERMHPDARRSTSDVARRVVLDASCYTRRARTGVLGLAYQCRDCISDF